MPEDPWRKTEVIFAGVVAVFTIVLAVASFVQWESSKHTTHVLERAYMVQSGSQCSTIRTAIQTVTQVTFRNAGRPSATNRQLPFH